MKKLLIALIVLVVVTGGVLALAAVNANAIAGKYKPDLERLAGEALGNTVTFGAISVSVFPSAKLVVDEVKLESEGETLTLANLTLKVDLIPLLTRTLKIRTLLLIEPDITVFLEKDGVFIAGLPRAMPDQPPEPGAAPIEAEAPAAARAESAELPFSVSLDSLELRDATITIKDAVSDTEYAITHLSVRAALAFEDNRVAMKSIDGGATILTDTDLQFTGKNVSYNLVGGALGIETMTAELLDAVFKVTGRLDPTDATQALRLTSNKIDLASLGPIYDVFAPGLNDLALHGSAEADLTFAWKADGGYSAHGTIDVSDGQSTVADITLANIRGRISIEADEQGMAFATDDTQATLGDSSLAIRVASSVDEKMAAFETLTVEAFEGTGELTTQIELAGDMPFTSGLKLSNMQVEPLVLAILPDTPMNITGNLESVTGNIEGTFNEDLMPSITGSTTMALTNGLIRDVNLGKQVLGAVTEIPFISGALLNAVPDALRAFLEKDHTVLESVKGSFTIAEETLTTEDLTVVSDFFTLEATGTIGFDTRLDLDSTIYFSPEFSEGMANQTNEIRILFDESGRLAFPVKVSGIAPKLAVYPDVSKLLERALKGTIREEAGKVLKDILGEQDTEEGGTKKRGLLDRLGIKP